MVADSTERTFTPEEEATDDLFTWWEETARVNRAAAREVADLYFARFDARLEKGLTELRAEFRTEMAGQRADLPQMDVHLLGGDGVSPGRAGDRALQVVIPTAPAQTASNQIIPQVIP